MSFTKFEEKFMLEYVKDWNASRAYSAANGTVGMYDRQDAYKLLQTHTIKTEVARRRAKIVARAELTIEDVVRDIKRVLDADPRELIEHRKQCCRYCYGEMHLYQHTPQEFRDAYVKHMASKKGLQGAPFDAQGGEGFDPRRDANPSCPECFGDGVTEIFIHDTRTLSPEAAALYEGMKNGEPIMRSKDKAREAAMRYLGMDKLDMTIRGGKIKDLTNEELLALIAKENPS